MQKRRARAAQDAGGLSPTSRRREEEFNEIRILLLQNQLLLIEEKEKKDEEKRSEEKRNEEKRNEEKKNEEKKNEEKKKKEDILVTHDGEETKMKQNAEEGQMMSGSILLLLKKAFIDLLKRKAINISTFS